MTHSPAARRPWVLLFIAVCLIAANLRVTIMGIGPLLDEIADDQHVSPAALGALASVPLLAWGIFSPLAQGFSSRFGMSRTVSGALVILALGTIWRSLPGPQANIWIGTALIGFGLAIGNVLMPAVIKRDFGERVPLVMGVYTALLSGSAAIAAGLVVPISHFEPGGSGQGLGWRVALLATGALIPPALIVWIWATRRPRPADPGPFLAGAESARATGGVEAAGPADDRAGRRIWRDPLAWRVSVYMGTQSAGFYMLSAWLAPYSASIGRDPVVAGIDVMIYQLFGIAGSLMLPLVARGRVRPWVPGAVPAITLIAVVGVLVAPALLPLWLVIAGTMTGSAITIALTLTASRARTARHAAALSGMAQSVGYLIAMCGPIAFGWVLGLGIGWAAPFALVWVSLAAQSVFGFSVRRQQYVLDRPERR